MYYAYLIENTANRTYYVGITVDPHERWLRHKSNARNNEKHSYLYNAMRQYGVGSFTFEVLKEFSTRSDCEQFEIDTIQFFHANNVQTYNLHEGGTLGASMADHANYEAWKQKQSAFMLNQKANDPVAFDAWRTKLKQARKGRTPALGMKHSEENRHLFKDVSIAYWSTQDTYDNYIDDILKLSHKEAKLQFGISTTHYYRLKKRFTTNVSE